MYVALSSYYFSHGEREIPKPMAVLAIVFFLVEPLAIWYKTGIENHRRESKDRFRFGGWVGAACIILSRAVFRTVYIAIAIKSLAPELWIGAVAFGLAFASIVKECHTMYLIWKSKAKKPKLVPEILAQFILVNQMVLFVLFFTSMIGGGTDYFQWGVLQGVFYYFVFFLFLFIPNRIVEYYSDFIDLKTPNQKFYYFLSVVWIYVTIVVAARWGV